MIVLEDYLKGDGIAEDKVLEWTKLFPIKISETLVRDRVYYWKDQGFFDYSLNSNYKLFFNKAPHTDIWVTINGERHRTSVDSNLRLYVYDLKEEQNFKIQIDDIIYENVVTENKIIEIEIDSTTVNTIKITDNQGEYNYSNIFNDINRNLIYLGR